MPTDFDRWWQELNDATRFDGVDPDAARSIALCAWRHAVATTTREVLYAMGETIPFEKRARIAAVGRNLGGS